MIRPTLLALLGLTLVAGACSKSSMPPPDPPDLPFGGACADGCEGLACVDDGRFPGGYCTSVCDDETPCPDIATCVPDLGLPLCLAMCSGPADCRDGYRCWRGTCRPPCSSDGECGAESVCDTETGTCGGPECTTSDECPGTDICVDEMCVPMPVDAGPTDCDPATCDGVCVGAEYGGGCRVRCDRRLACPGVDACAVVGDTDGDGAAETVCLAPNLDGALLGGRCAVARGLTECDAYTCVASQCTEPCATADDCLAGQVCRDLEDADGNTWQGCGYADLDGTVDVIDFGEFDVDEGSGTRRLDFATANGSRSVTLVAERVSGDNLPLSFVSVFDPNNARLFDLNEISMLIDQPIRWFPLDSEGAIAMLIPNTPETRYLPGRHGFTVAALGGGDGSVRIRVRALVKRRTGNNLDVNVFVGPGLGFNAASAPGESQLQASLARFSTIFGQADISVGDVSYFDVTDSRFRVIDSTDGPGSELAQLFQQSAGRDGLALNIFLVQDIDGDGGGSTLGIAGGIPGPPGVHGSGHSGIVVAWGVLGGGSSIPGQVFAHETGHFLGLFHSTENGRPCGPGETMGCAPFGGGDPLDDTRYNDNRNMMFWALQTFGGSTVNDNMSADQAYVLIRNPLVLGSGE